MPTIAPPVATQAALRTTQIPNWVLTKDEDGDAVDFELSDDPYDVRGAFPPPSPRTCRSRRTSTSSFDPRASARSFARSTATSFH